MDITFMTGTAGSGKSLLTSALKNWYINRGEEAIAVNLDPGVVSLPYEPEVDVRETVDLQDLMTLTAQGKVTLHTSTYPLDAVNDAMADLDQGRLQGRGILVPAQAAA